MQLPFWLSKRRRFCSKRCYGIKVRRETEIKYQVACLTCRKIFKKESCSEGKFCSYKCYWESKRIYGNKPDCIDCGKKLTAHYCVRCEKCSDKYMVGERHSRWKGDGVGYRALHAWIERQLGRPNKCSECGKVGYGHQIHWANVSGQYLRDVSDWVRLCSKCHKAFDGYKKLLV